MATDGDVLPVLLFDGADFADRDGFARELSLAIPPDDPAATAEESQRRREEIGFSCFVVGADASDALAPVVATLAAT
jgi:hypothetical protein